MSRYDNIQKIINNSQDYSDLFYRKKINSIKQYSTFDFNLLKNYKDYNLDVVYYKVQPFDRMYNISNKYYGSPEYGWLICYTNSLSSELDLKINMMLSIYFPINTLLGLL